VKLPVIQPETSVRINADAEITAPITTASR
jgi:hypothetical protein